MKMRGILSVSQFILSHVRLFATSWTATHQASLSPNLGACSNSCPLSQFCYSTVSFSVVPFISCLQSFPATGTFPKRQFFTSSSQSIGASASVLPMNIKDYFPLGLTGWISMQFKGLRVFNTTVQSINSWAVNFLYRKFDIHT